MSILSIVTGSVWVVYVIISGYITALIKLFAPPKRRSIEGEIVVVTGAGHGIGREFALELGKLGALVVLLDINQETNEKTLKDVIKDGGKGATYVCDVSNPANVKDVFARIKAEVGDVDILVNNAGILYGGTILELSEAHIRRTLDVNTLSLFWTIRELLPAMINRGSGNILNVISVCGYLGSNVLTDYCASKFGAMGLHEALIEELSFYGHHGIKLTGLCPLFVNTGMLQNYSCSSLDRVLSPNEVARAGIDGMLRGYEIVRIPYKTMSFVLFLRTLLPRKTFQKLIRNTGSVIRDQYKKTS